MIDNPDEEAKKVEAEERRERMQKLAEELQLQECLDAIVILTSYRSGGITQSTWSSSGNTHAIFGVAKAFADETYLEITK